MSIHHHAGNGGEQKEWHNKCCADDSQSSGAAGFLIGPDRERKLRHARSQDRNQLPCPDDSKPDHSSQSFFRLHVHVPIIVLSPLIVRVFTNWKIKKQVTPNQRDLLCLPDFLYQVAH